MHGAGAASPTDGFLTHGAFAVRGACELRSLQWNQRRCHTSRLAVARKLAQLIYRLLRFGTAYADIGAEAYEKQFNDRRLAALEINANDLGLMLVPLPEAGG